MVRDTDLRTEHFLVTMDRDPASPTCGGAWMERRYRDPKPTAFLATWALACYLNADSRYHEDPAIVQGAALSLGYLERCQNPDGTFDFTPANFRSPPDTAFIVHSLVAACDLLARSESTMLMRLRERLLGILGAAAGGMAGIGFHTPNHRWALAAALVSCQRLLGDTSYRVAADRLLAEGIDSNEYGEYAERSAGNYNHVNNEQMITLADAYTDPAYLSHAVRNLEMMQCYVEPDGAVFTGNSTRQDRGVTTYLDAYWYHYYLLGRRLGRDDFLSIARRIMTEVVISGRPAPYCLDRLMLEGAPIDYGAAYVPACVTYEKHHRDSGIVRIRRDRWSCTLLADTDRFFHFRSGGLAASLRLCVTYFQMREFKTPVVDRANDTYRLCCLMKGWYYLPFDEHPGTSDWWRMDHTKRRKTTGPDLSFTVTVTQLPAGDGVELATVVTGWERVPLRFEITLDPGAQVEGDGFVVEARPAGEILVKSGLVRVRSGLDAIALGPFFAEHNEIRGIRGAEVHDHERFTAYATAFTPMTRSLIVRRASPEER
jgi:hypothetical protein